MIDDCSLGISPCNSLVGIVRIAQAYSRLIDLDDDVGTLQVRQGTFRNCRGSFGCFGHGVGQRSLPPRYESENNCEGRDEDGCNAGDRTVVHVKENFNISDPAHGAQSLPHFGELERRTLFI